MAASLSPAMITSLGARPTDWIWAGIATFGWLILRELARMYRN